MWNRGKMFECIICKMEVEFFNRVFIIEYYIMTKLKFCRYFLILL